MRYKGEKGKAWEALRNYVIARDGGQCVTCHRSKKQGNIMQGGHYQPVGLVGSNNKLSWDETNVYCQCAYCNGIGQGQQELMAKHIERVHGKEVLEELKSRVHKIDPIKDWVEVKEYYKDIINNYEKSI